MCQRPRRHSVEERRQQGWQDVCTKPARATTPPSIRLTSGLNRQDHRHCSNTPLLKYTLENAPHINNCTPIMCKSQMNIHQSYSIQIWPHIKECPLHETMHLCCLPCSNNCALHSKSKSLVIKSLPKMPYFKPPVTQIATIFNLGTLTAVSCLRQHK
jgi:hypothetical protein